MTTIHSAMALIESPTFDATTGVASDLDTLLKAATGTPVAEIMHAAETSSGQLVLAKRVLELVERDFDVRYLNPADTAITVYLWILANTRPSLAKGVATAALGLRNGWWAPRMSRRVLAAHRETAPVTTAVWVSLPNTSATVDLGTGARDESAISPLGFARYLRDANFLVEGSTTSVPSSDSITLTYTLDTPASAFGVAGNAETVNDNLALAA
jgi:hypothetical protein